MIITFFAYSARHPMGGSKTIYELANHLARRGHQIHLVHFGIGDEVAQSFDNLAWFDFEPGIEHRLMQADGDYGELPAGDFIQPLDTTFPAHAGKPFNFVQGYKIMPPELEVRMFAYPWPKVCVGSWLVAVGRELGVHEEQLIHMPNGIEHEVFHQTRPIEGRPPQVAMLYHEHFMKGTKFGVEALVAAKAAVPELEARLFGTTPPPSDLPSWVRATQLPSRAELVEEIYNGSQIMLSPSLTEGFGYTSVEAMACGCALVTAANGGQEDFAFHGDTALVAPGKDGPALAEHLITLLRDDEARVSMARRGAEYVQRFTWDRSTDILEDFLTRYGQDPARYQQPNDDVTTPQMRGAQP